MESLISGPGDRAGSLLSRPGIADRPHRVWWLGLWPGSAGVTWWLTHRLLLVDGPGPVAEPLHGVVPSESLAGPLARLQSALVGADSAGPAGEEGARADVRRAWHGALATAGAEFDLSVTLGRLLLPRVLTEALSRATPDEGSPVPTETVVIAAGPTLSRVPFELLVIDELRGLRLLESARVRAGLSAAAAVGAEPPATRPLTGPLRVIDPGPSARSAAQRGGVYAGGVPGPIYASDWIDERWLHRHRDRDVLLHQSELMVPVTRELLSQSLCARPERMLFLGHAVSGAADSPSRAGLVLADPAAGGPFEPFTAAHWIQSPQRWPAPPKVALVSCHSNDTHLFEQMGLVQAAVHAGAMLVTSTRWVLPADHTAGPGTATTELALAVDTAHDTDDPIGAIRSWQLSRLAAWRAQPGPETAPLIWAAALSYQRGPLPIGKEREK